MDFLHAVVAGLSLHDPDANVIEDKANRRKAIRLTGRLGSDRHRLPPRAERTVAAAARSGALARLELPVHAARAASPTRGTVRDLDCCLVLHADHELNASAFSARVTSSTLSGLYSSVMAAIGTLKGPLHGGANEQVMRMLLEIGKPEKVEAYLDEALAGKRKVMGFGHRVYKEGDPRAKILKAMSQRLTRETGCARALRDERRCSRSRWPNEKGLIPNVDFYSATVYYAMKIPIDLFTPVFAASRVAGWCAHVIEQYANNRIYRPRAQLRRPDRPQLGADRPAQGAVALGGEPAGCPGREGRAAPGLGSQAGPACWRPRRAFLGWPSPATGPAQPDPPVPVARRLARRDAAGALAPRLQLELGTGAPFVGAEQRVAPHAANEAPRG